MLLRMFIMEANVTKRFRLFVLLLIHHLQLRSQPLIFTMSVGMNKLYQKFRQISGLFRREEKNEPFTITSITVAFCSPNGSAEGLQLSPQPRTSIASRFQWGRKIKVQIQLLFRVADLWVFCLIYVTLIEVPKEIAAGSCTKGSHHVFTKLRQEAAIKMKWVSHLRSMRESCLAKSCLKCPLFTLL